jgi:hypothetical protein
VTPAEREALALAVTTAHRARDPFTGEVRAHPSWHDLDEEGRALAYDETLRARALEAALDADGLTTTARAILARISAKG